MKTRVQERLSGPCRPLRGSNATLESLSQDCRPWRGCYPRADGGSPVIQSAIHAYRINSSCVKRFDHVASLLYEST